MKGLWVRLKQVHAKRKTKKNERLCRFALSVINYTFGYGAQLRSLAGDILSFTWADLQGLL